MLYKTGIFTLNSLVTDFHRGLNLEISIYKRSGIGINSLQVLEVRGTCVNIPLLIELVEEYILISKLLCPSKYIEGI